METEAELEDLISSTGPRTLNLSNEENLNFCDEEECIEGEQ